MKHVLQAKVEAPNPKDLPSDLLDIMDVKVELSLRVGNATISCDTTEEMAALVKKMYVNELERRKKISHLE